MTYTVLRLRPPVSLLPYLAATDWSRSLNSRNGSPSPRRELPMGLERVVAHAEHDRVGAEDVVVPVAEGAELEAVRSG